MSDPTDSSIFITLTPVVESTSLERLLPELRLLPHTDGPDPSPTAYLHVDPEHLPLEFRSYSPNGGSNSPPPLPNSVPTGEPSHLNDPSNLKRINEHKAIILPRYMWEKYEVMSTCRNPYCRAQFGLFVRGRHCRMCGEVFCAKCTSHTTTLLDLTNTPLTALPKGSKIADYQSPASPIVSERVCDYCWGHLHGQVSTSKGPFPGPSRATRTWWVRFVGFFACRPRGVQHLSPVNSGDDFDVIPLAQVPIPLTRTRTYAKTAPLPQVHARRPTSGVSFGGMDAYPLVLPSELCKATGGGRWEPKQDAWAALDRGDNEEPIEENWGEGVNLGRQDGTWVVDGPFQYRLNQRSSRRSQER